MIKLDRNALSKCCYLLLRNCIAGHWVISFSKKKCSDVTITQQPRVNIYSNYTGKRHIYKERQIREAIIRQVCSPVRWEQIQYLLYAKHQVTDVPSYAKFLMIFKVFPALSVLKMHFHGNLQSSFTKFSAFSAGISRFE